MPLFPINLFPFLPPLRIVNTLFVIISHVAAVVIILIFVVLVIVMFIVIAVVVILPMLNVQPRNVDVYIIDYQK